MRFRALALTADFEDENAPEVDTTLPQPPTCSYCGSTEFEGVEDNGRVQRAKCAACDGTMVSHGGAWMPDLIGSPHNHPKMDADPASGGVGGAGAGSAPVVQLQTNDLNQHAAAVDWCRHRHAEHCWLPNREAAGPIALYPPQDRGVCPWKTASQQQINCPMSEAGPMAGMERAASVLDSELSFHFVSTWADVRNKAKKIRSEGGVSIVVASGDGVGGHVQGDTGIYETILNYAPGSYRVANWQCGCAWAAYAWNRSPAYRRFEGRMCSHALALQYEAQSRGMFGKDVAEDRTSPAWMRDKVRQRYDRDTGVHDLVHASLQDPLDPEGVYPRGHGLDLAHPPLYAFAVTSTIFGQDPATTIEHMLRHGMNHAAAQELLHEAIDHVRASNIDWDRVKAEHEQRTAALPGPTHETRCPDCGAEISSTAEHCPRCGANLNQGDTGDQHLASNRVNSVSIVSDAASSVPKASGEGEPPSEPTHAGVVLKAADTGRVLMIQRSHKDPDDPAAGTWEFPGGGREPHDAHSLHSGIREFEEETGHPFPTGGHVSHVWQSPNGVYQGHVVVVPSEDALDFTHGRSTVNPDDPDGDDHEQSAWWDPDHAKKNPALRPECKTSPWDKIKAASLRASAFGGAGAGTVVVGSGAVPASTGTYSALRDECKTNSWGQIKAATLSSFGYAAEQRPTTPEVNMASGSSFPKLVHAPSANKAAGLAKAARSEEPTWYHGTSSTLSPDIETHGLERPYLTSDVDQARYYADAATDEHGGKPAVYRVHAHPELLRYDRAAMEEPVHGHPVDPGRHVDPSEWQVSNDAVGSVRHDGNVPPERLRREATYSANEGLTDPEIADYRPKPPPRPLDGSQENPASTGFATAGDPPEFDQQLSTRQQTTPFAAAMAIMHMEPEPALPSTEADEEVGTPGERYRSQMSPSIDTTEQTMVPQSVHTAQTTEEIIAAFQATAAGQKLAASKGASTVDIASAARAFLTTGVQPGPGMTHTALKDFSFGEQQELINEGAADGRRARNFADLKIEGTHYESLNAALAAGEIDDNAEDLFV